MRRALFFLPLFALLACNGQLLPASTHTPEPPDGTSPAPAATATSETESPPLIVDGSFSDWEPIEPAHRDPAGDAGDSGVDIGAIQIAHSDDQLPLSVELGKIVNLQAETALSLEIRQEGGPTIRYDFGDREGYFNGLTVNHSGLGVVTMPSHSSDTFEIALWHSRFSQDAPLTLSFADPGRNGDQAPNDEAGITYAWDRPVPAVDPLPLQKTAPGALRVLSYNVPMDGVLDGGRADLFERIFRALDPDVVLIQEARNRPAASYETRLEDWLGGDWTARKQRDLIIASRLPFLDGWQDPAAGLHVRLFPQMLDVNGSPLVVFTAHLSCCAKDQERQEQADGLIRYLREGPLEAGTPFLILGDLNLVGDFRQVRTLVDGDILDEGRFGPDHLPDWDATGLAAPALRHSHSRMTYTWYDSGDSFGPGRLDYLIFTDSLLAAQGFVLDTSRLPESLLADFGLQAEDTGKASDHLPLVVDVTFLTPQ